MTGDVSEYVAMTTYPVAHFLQLLLLGPVHPDVLSQDASHAMQMPVGSLKYPAAQVTLVAAA